MSKLTLSFKGRVLKVFPVLQGEMTIGSDPACTIHVDSLALQPRHARIVTQGTESVLEDLDTEEGTHVNQARIQQHQLKDGDLIRIGKHTLSFAFQEEVEPVSVAPAAASPIDSVAEPTAATRGFTAPGASAVRARSSSRSASATSRAASPRPFTARRTGTRTCTSTHGTR